jgi:hypothetical protein
MGIDIISLTDLVKMASERHVQEVILSFKCEKNSDIEEFLKKKAVLFETQSKSKTYLLLDKERFSRGKVHLLAYFSVALKVLDISVLNLSNRKIKELDGFSAKIRGEAINEFPVYLIGQLAKNDLYKDDIDGEIIIRQAMSVISSAQEKVGGRIILVECDEIPALVEFYETHSFSVIRRDTDKFVQLIRIIV